jgi:hypothetical protein
MAKMEVLSWHLPGGTERKHEKSPFSETMGKE